MKKKERLTTYIHQIDVIMLKLATTAAHSFFQACEYFSLVAHKKVKIYDDWATLIKDIKYTYPTSELS